MNKVLNNIIKGLLVAFAIVISGGIIYLNVKISPNTSMVLVSSSIANSIKTNNVKLDKKEDNKITEEIELKEEVKEIEEDTEEKIEEVVEKEETVVTPVVPEEPKKEEPVVETPAPAPSVPAPSGSYSPTADAGGESNFSYEGYVTAYGPDCVGCGGYTAMGDYVGEGNIYYNHPTYGTIRIVAGDRDMLNKVVRITGLNISAEPVIAIVRDTGGDIGRNKPKKIVLDLLYTSESSSEVLNFGKQWVKVEVLN